MVALIVLLLILVVFGGLGFAAHFLWFLLIAALVIWAIGFLIGGVGLRHGQTSLVRALVKRHVPA